MSEFKYRSDACPLFPDDVNPGSLPNDPPPDPTCPVKTLKQRSPPRLGATKNQVTETVAITRTEAPIRSFEPVQPRELATPEMFHVFTGQKPDFAQVSGLFQVIDVPVETGIGFEMMAQAATQAARTEGAAAVEIPAATEMQGSEPTDLDRSAGPQVEEEQVAPRFGRKAVLKTHQRVSRAAPCGYAPATRRRTPSSRRPGHRKRSPACHRQRPCAVVRGRNGPWLRCRYRQTA